MACVFVAAHRICHKEKLKNDICLTYDLTMTQIFK